MGAKNPQRDLWELPGSKGLLYLFLAFLAVLKEEPQSAQRIRKGICGNSLVQKVYCIYSLRSLRF